MQQSAPLSDSDPAARDLLPAFDPGSAAYVEAWDHVVAAQPAPSRRGGGFGLLREALQVAVIAALIFVGTRTVVQGREVLGPSMQPTYHTGERLFVTRYFFHGPHRGDVIVFHPPTPSKDDYIKRVIGVPGDHVLIKDGRVWVNDQLLDESYLAKVQTTCFSQFCNVVLGPDQYFVMGDNRPNSSDSRFWGPVSGDKIVGKAWLLYYPFSDFGFAP